MTHLRRKVGTSAESDGPSPMPGEDKQLPEKPVTNTAPLTIANAEATATADDEIIIGEQRLIGERRVAAMLGYGQRQLQRWCKEQKGPASSKIGRRLFYELNTLQEWIEREKSRVMPAVRIWPQDVPSHQSISFETRNVLAEPRGLPGNSSIEAEAAASPTAIRALVLFGRRPHERAHTLVMPATENLHNAQ